MTRKHLIIALLPAAFVLANCGAKKAAASNDVVVSEPAVAAAEDSVIHIPSKLQNFPEIAAETDIQKLASRIAEENCVYERAVGFAGAYTEMYACYERLCQLASDEVLLQLTDHASPAVRVYALRGLMERKSASREIEVARTKLIKDTAKVGWFSGCNRSTQTVAFFASIQQH